MAEAAAHKQSLHARMPYRRRHCCTGKPLLHFTTTIHCALKLYGSLAL